MNLLRCRPIRLPLVACVAVAWVALSNHCAIAAMQATAKMPMPSCHRVAPSKDAPEKDNQDGVECCKVLRATLSVAAKNVAAPGKLHFVSTTYASAVVAAPAAQIATVLQLDTGPPDALSFSESVLQRSVLAHAPPVSLS